jgi:antitoxin PrlF
MKDVRSASMPTAKVTSKGQITIPAEVRKTLGLKTGEKVAFLPGENGEFRMRRAGSIMDLCGFLAGIEVPKSDEEMNQAIAEYVAELDEATKSDAKPVKDEEAA